EVVLCHASDGDKGHYEIPPDELVQIRRREAEQAGAVIGSRVLSLGLSDGEIAPENEGVRSAVVDLICSVRPDLVITHAPNDYMPDHNALSRLVFDSTFLATLPGSSKNHQHAEKVPSLYYMD